MQAGCAQPVIEMSLQLPNPSDTIGFDLSCVGAAKVEAIGSDPGDGRQAQVIDQCVDVSTGLRSFTDVQTQFRGKFALDVPSTGLAGVQLRGISGRCSDPASSTYDSIFYGGAPGNGKRMVIAVTPGLSCNTAQVYNVRVLDLLALYASPNSCPTPSDAVSLFSGAIRPRMLGDKQPRTMFEFGASSTKTTTGTGMLQSYKAVTTGPSCIAFSYRGVSSIGLACINNANEARGLCGAAGETEIVAMPISALPPLPEPTATYGTIVIGAVWETAGASKAPLSNATVALLDPSQGTVMYVDLAIQAGVSPPRFQPLLPVNGATATTSTGGFVVYLKGDPTNLVVSAPGHTMRIVRIASAPDVIATLVVPLSRP